MKLQIRAGLLASALMLSAVPLVASATITPVAAAQIDVSFRYFHNQLSRSGDWVYSDRWGEVWLPAYVDANWRPYSRGYWVDTDEYGWLWVSNDGQFGDITSHYGRWVNDPYDGWMWIPGYVWSPAWVVWRRSGDYTGWMPMPPDRRFLSGEEFGNVSLSIGGLSISFNNWGNADGYYGYSRWYGRRYSQNHFNAMWTFVPVRHFADRDYRRYEAPRRSIPNYVRNSTNITNYAVVNNYIVNRSVSDKSFQGVDLKGFRRVRAADVVGQPALIVPVNRGQELQLRMRREMPRGTGLNNSAPKPTRAQVESLSVPSDANAQQRAARRASRLLTRDGAASVARPDGSAPTPLTPDDSMKAKDVIVDKKGTSGNAISNPANANQPTAPTTDTTAKEQNKARRTQDNAVTSPATAPATDTVVKNKARRTQDNAVTSPATVPATDTVVKNKARRTQDNGVTSPATAPATDTVVKNRARRTQDNGVTSPATAPATDTVVKNKARRTQGNVVTSPATAPATDTVVKNKARRTQDNAVTGPAPVDTPSQAPDQPRADRVKAPDVTPTPNASTPDAARAERRKARAKGVESAPMPATPPAAAPDSPATNDGQAVQPAASGTDQTVEKKKKKHPKPAGETPTDAPQ